MRSIGTFRCSGILLAVLAASMAAHGQQVSPHRDIRWPINCQGGPGMIYNWVNNTCVNLNAIDPSHQVVWPPACTSGVYSPAGNTCVPPGTAANPAPPVGSGQMNAGGIFTAIPGFMSDPTNGFITAGGVTYAKGSQTGNGANGIVNAVANGRVVRADPSYGVTTTANMTQNSATFTVTSAAGIVPGMRVSGNVMTGYGVVSTVAGNTVTLNGTVAQTTNPSATVTFYEMPYGLGGYNIPNASVFEYQGQLPGQMTDLKRDPPGNPFSGTNDFNTEGCFTTKHQAWINGGATGGAQVNSTCHHLDSWFAAPSPNYGTTGHGPSNWGITTALALNNVVSSKGIGELMGGTHAKAGIGDGPLAYWYYIDYGGSIAGADEGQGGIFTGGGEGPATTTGSVTASSLITGGVGSLLSINCSTDCSSGANNLYGGPGQGRYFLDLSHPITFNMTNRTSFSGDTPGTITSDATMPVSTFWGTISAVGGGDVSVAAALSASGKPFAEQNPATTVNFIATSGTFNSVANTGSPHVGDLICFSGTYHEQATISNVTGTGPWTVTAPLRMPHAVNSWVFANGPCGDFVDFAANDVYPPGNGFPGQILHFPFDIIGSVNANTLVYRWFSNLLTSTFFPLGNIAFPLGGGGSLTNQGGIVTIPFIAASTTPQYIGQPVITIAGATNAAFNGPCYNVAVNGQGQGTCFQAASTGLTTTPVTTYSISIGTTGYGNTQAALFQGAELLDILDYSETNCAATVSKHAPCYDNQNFVLEPNAAAWNTATVTAPITSWSITGNVATFQSANTLAAFDIIRLSGFPTSTFFNGQSIVLTSASGTQFTAAFVHANGSGTEAGTATRNGDTVEVAHHYSSQIKGGKNGLALYNPYTQNTTNGWNYSIAGQGANGAANWAAFNVTNLNGVGMYQGHGGALPIPGGWSLGNGTSPSQGSISAPGFNYGLAFVTAPEPNNLGRGLWFGCPSLPWGCSDPTYNYRIADMLGRNTGNYIMYNPYNSDILLGNPNNPVTWNGVNNDINYLQVRDQLKLSPMATPVINSTSTATSNGTIPDGTTRYYEITARNFAGWSLASAQASQATGTSGSNANTITVFWSHVDGATQYQVCESATSGTGFQLLATVAGVDGTSFLDAGGTASGGCQNVATAPPLILTSQGTTFTDSLVAATGNAASVTHTLPSATGTLTVSVAAGTYAMPTTAVAAGGCSGAGTVTVTSGAQANILATDSTKWSWQAAPANIVGNLIVNPFTTAGGIGFIYCNPGAGSLTPPAATLNWQVSR